MGSIREHDNYFGPLGKTPERFSYNLMPVPAPPCTVYKATSQGNGCVWCQLRGSQGSRGDVLFTSVQFSSLTSADTRGISEEEDCRPLCKLMQGTLIASTVSDVAPLSQIFGTFFCPN